MRCTLLKTRVQQAFLLHDTFFFLFNREPLASEKITCFYVYGASAQLGEPRFHAVRVNQSGHGEDARSTYASFGTQKNETFFFD